jgi:hypothetical protein
VATIISPLDWYIACLIKNTQAFILIIVNQLQAKVDFNHITNHASFPAISVCLHGICSISRVSSIAMGVLSFTPYVKIIYRFQNTFYIKTGRCA